MEQDLQELKLESLTMKLTSEKLYVNSISSNETFALRSVNGIGIVDLVEKFNQDLNEWEKKTSKPWIAIIPLGLIALFFLKVFIDSATTTAVGFFSNEPLPPDYYLLFISCLFAVPVVFLLFRNMNLPKPLLKSAVRIMLNGMSRDFEFDKKLFGSQEVAKFVALVEDTLTSYHKAN